MVESYAIAIKCRKEISILRMFDFVVNQLWFSLVFDRYVELDKFLLMNNDISLCIHIFL